MKIFESVFDKKYINTSRQKELDVFKGIAIFVMIWSHLLIWMASDAQLETGIGYIMDNIISGPPGAATFMFCMGIGIWYSAYHRGEEETLESGYLPAGLIKRGLKIFGVGVALNLVRAVILPLCGYAVFREQEYLEDLKFFFCADIYQFAGLALILLGTFQKLKIKKNWLLPISLVMSLLGWALRGTTTGVEIIDLILSVFAPLTVYSFFALLSWFIFPVAGFLFAPYLARCKNKKKFYAITGISGTVIYAIYTAICIVFNCGYIYYVEDELEAFYQCTTIDAILYFSAVFGVLALSYFIIEIFKNCKFTTLNRWSRNIMEMYAISWLLILLATIIPEILEMETTPHILMFSLAIIITILCDVIVTNVKKHISKKKNPAT